MQYTTRMVLIPENLYERLLKNKKESSPEFTTKLEMTPFLDLDKQMNELKKNKKMSSLEKNLRYNHVHKRINKIFTEEKNKPIPVTNLSSSSPQSVYNHKSIPVTNVSSSKIIQEQQSVYKNRTDVPLEEKTNLVENNVPNNTKKHDISEINFLDNYETPFKENSREINLYNYIKDKSNDFSFNKNLEVLKEDGQIVKGSDVKQILEYLYSDNAWKKKYRKPNGYEILINKLIKNDYVNKNFLHQKGEGKHTFCFKPLLW